MACFLAPVAEAIVVTIVKKNIEKKEQTALLSAPDKQSVTGAEFDEQRTMPFSRKLGWLSNLLWGGSFLLALEHIWHGEVVPWPPFLTAMNNPADVGPMLLEIATVGVTMALLITAVWGVMVLVSNRIGKKSKKPAAVKTMEV